MRIIYEEIRYTNLVHFIILPEKIGDIFHIGDVTPDISNIEFWQCSGDVLTITNFLKGSPFQRLHILGDGNTTIANNANIKTSTGANQLLSANKVYRFTLFNTTWISDA